MPVSPLTALLPGKGTWAPAHTGTRGVPLLARESTTCLGKVMVTWVTWAVQLFVHNWSYWTTAKAVEMTPGWDAPDAVAVRVYPEPRTVAWTPVALWQVPEERVPKVATPPSVDSVTPPEGAGRPA